MTGIQQIEREVSELLDPILAQNGLELVELVRRLLGRLFEELVELEPQRLVGRRRRNLRHKTKKHASIS